MLYHFADEPQSVAFSKLAQTRYQLRYNPDYKTLADKFRLRFSGEDKWT